MTLPIRPSPLTTGWSTRTPSDEPLSMLIVAYQTVGEWPITRAVTGRCLVEPAPWSSSSSSRSCGVLARRGPVGDRPRCAARVALAAQLARPRPCASSVSPNQPNRSRTGLSARLAPSWIGERTSSTPRCTPCSTPPAASPKYAVSRASEPATSSPRTARRLRTVFCRTRGQ